MKIFGPNSLSNYLFYISQLATIGTLLLLVFILISFVTGNYELVDNQFSIQIPFTETNIKGVYKNNVIGTISLILSFFIIFFYMLSSILKTFKAKKLFTEQAIKWLNRFAFLNLLVGPLLYFYIHFFVMNKTNFRDIHNLILSLLLGFFVLFIIAIFKRGFQVQSENDLTI